MSQREHRPSHSTPPLQLAPFRAMRFNSAVVPDLGVVTCPPYDVIAADKVAEWEAADPHNVVRLILPRSAGTNDRHTRAATTLRHWLDDSVLIRDEQPALYVYEHSVGDQVALGLVGAVSLHNSTERRILPHEDVFHKAVADRAALMSATRTQLEPILLTYDGDGRASDIVDKTAETAPTLDVRTANGDVHRLWQITDPTALATVSADLASRQALIADGHHRYAAYLALRDGETTSGTSYAFGLAMLVDASRHPLRLAAIHRSVSDLPFANAVAAARRGFHSVNIRPATAAADTIAELATVTESISPAFAITDGRELALLADPDPDLVRSSMPADRSRSWQSLDASVARELVLGELWRVNDADQRVAYHHRPTDAQARAKRTSGVALFLNPPRHADILTLAAAGERMPRKSTSFGPKPRTGLLMRLLDDEPPHSSLNRRRA